MEEERVFVYIPEEIGTIIRPRWFLGCLALKNGNRLWCIGEQDSLSCHKSNGEKGCLLCETPEKRNHGADSLFGVDLQTLKDEEYFIHPI